MLTDEQKAAYVRTGGADCPYCGAKNAIEGMSGFGFEDAGTWQAIRCLKCGKQWQDIYTLTGIEEVE